MAKDKEVLIGGNMANLPPLKGNDKPTVADNKAQSSQTKTPQKAKPTWTENIKNAKGNWKKIKNSPFASLSFSLKVRKIIVALLIAYIGWSGFWMVWNFRAEGFMNILGKAIMGGIIAYVCWVIYKTIPAAKKQLEYYKRNPHLINYTPVDAKTTVDEIMAKIKDNQKKLKEG